MKTEGQPTGDSSGVSLSKESAMSAEPGGGHGEDIKVRLARFATHRGMM